MGLDFEVRSAVATEAAAQPPVAELQSYTVTWQDENGTAWHASVWAFNPYEACQLVVQQRAGRVIGAFDNNSVR